MTMTKNRKILPYLIICALIFSFATVFLPNAFAKNQVVVCNWGGRSADFEKECFYDPFEKATGIKVIMTSPPVVGKIKAQVDSGNIEWDIILTDIPAVMAMTEGETTYLEEIDYSRLDKAVVEQIIPETRKKYSIGGRVYSLNICYNTNTFKDDHPRTWADVWDIKKYPGIRSFNNTYGGIPPQYEMFLLADGVTIDQLFPIDVERAWKSLDKLKPNITKWYKSHSQAVQMLVSGEVDIACTIGPRVIAAKWDGAPVDVEYNGGKLASDNWCIIKGAKNKDSAYKLINFILDAKRQACFSSKAPYGPTNMTATQYIDPKIAKDLNTAPDNLKKQFWPNREWWMETDADGKTNRANSIERFTKWLAE